jgi:hypothetical protein
MGFPVRTESLGEEIPVLAEMKAPTGHESTPHKEIELFYPCISVISMPDFHT